MNPRQGVLRGPRHCLQGWGYRLILAQYQQTLGSVAPPAVGMLQMAHQLRRRFIEHARPGAAGLAALMTKPPDSAATVQLVELVLLDLPAQIGAGIDPGGFLDDPTIHIDDKKRAVRGCRHIHGAKEL